MGAAQTKGTRAKATTAPAWESHTLVTDGAFAQSEVPLAGFSVAEADDLDEMIQMVAWTPIGASRAITVYGQELIHK